MSVFVIVIPGVVVALETEEVIPVPLVVLTLATVPALPDLLLNVLQSVEVKAPVVDALAVAIDIVVEPVPVLLDDIGDEPDTLVTPDDELVPAPINVLISAPVTPDAKVGVPPPENIPGSANAVKPLGFVEL